MRDIRIYLTLLFGILGIATSFGERHTIEVGQFEKLKINGNFPVIYKNLPDSTGMVRYDAPADSGDVYKFITKGDGSLKVEPTDEKWGQSDLPLLYVYSDFLSSVESYSEQTVEIATISPCASFTGKLIGNGTLYIDNVKSNNVSASITTGNGSIYISGNCVNASFKMVGTGLISADQLKADNVKCRILGTGSIGCWPVDNLNVTGLGTTKIYYKGSPHIKKTGGGKLFELPEDMDEDAYARLGTPVESFNQPENDEETEIEEEDEEEDYQTIVTADD